MPSIVYNRDVPDPPNSPSVDVPKMKQNTNSIDDIWNVDHFSFSNSNAGFHNLIHLVSQTAPNTNVGQLYSQDVTTNSTVSSTDTQQFYTSKLGVVSQMTGLLNPAADGADGYAWVGGLLVQWGTVSQSFAAGSTTGNVTFKDRVAGAIPFPNFCFMVQTTPLVSFASLPANQACINIRQSSLSNTKFDWQFFSLSSSYKGFFWIAVGL